MAARGGPSPRRKGPSVGTLGVPKPNPHDGGGDPGGTRNNSMSVSICTAAGR